MTQKEFSRVCKEHGFSKHARHLYTRCIGDGIYQTIYTGFRTYISPESHNYSPAKRKSNYILVGIHSLFSPFSEDFFTPTPTGGEFLPDHFCPKTTGKRLFHGIEDEYDKMYSYGFEMLNSINTHEALLDFYCKTKVSSRGTRLHNTSLIIPYLLTGQTDEALFEICYNYTVSWCGYNRTHDESHDSEQSAELRARRSEINEILAPTVFLFRAILGKRHQDIYRYLNDNYERNLMWIKQYNIPLFEGFHKREIPMIF